MLGISVNVKSKRGLCMAACDLLRTTKHTSAHSCQAEANEKSNGMERNRLWSKAWVGVWEWTIILVVVDAISGDIWGLSVWMWMHEHGHVWVERSNWHFARGPWPISANVHSVEWSTQHIRDIRTCFASIERRLPQPLIHKKVDGESII